MKSSIVVWVIWLLVWHGSGSQAQQQVQVITGPVTIHATAQGTTVSVGSTCQAPGCSVGQGADGAQIATNIITTGTTIRTVETQQATVALHEYVYKNDFAGFRDKMRFLDRKENQGSLIGSLQSTDDKGLTIAHLMACVGRPDELSLITQAVQKVMDGLVPLGQKVFKRASLESFSFNASCTSCRSQQEVVPHLRLELTNPRQTIFLYGNVTPLECAAAHGHTDAMKLLMQQGVHPGRALFVAQQFGLENNLFEAVRRAKQEGGLGAALHPELPHKLDTPLRKPRQRRTERKAKSKPKSSTGSSVKQATAAAAAPVAAAPACGCNAQPPPPPQQQPSQGSCGAQPVALTMTPQPGVERPGGAPNRIGTVSTSLLGAKEKDRDPSKPVSTPNQLSEVMDVTALWLLSIMLLFPAWSTLCLLLRKMLKRRSALQDSVTKVRRAVWSVAKPFKPADSSVAAAAAVAPPAAASGGAGLQRSSTGVPDTEAKASSKSWGAATRQQRKPGPSIALPASADSDPGGANKAPGSPGGLYTAISAPEATFRAHSGSSGSSQGAKGKDGSSQAAASSGSNAGAGARRQGSSVAMLSSIPSVPSTAAGAGLGAAAAATEVLPVPPLRHSHSANLAARSDDKAPAAIAAGAAAVAGSSTGKGAAASSAGKQKRGKQAAGPTVTFAAPAATPFDAKEKDSSKGSQHAAAAAARHTPSSSTSSSSSSSGPAKVTRTGSGASDSSTGSSPAPAPAASTAPRAARGTPQVLFKASAADKHTEATAADNSTADPALGARKEGLCKAAGSAGVYKTRSEASGLLAAASNRSASRAAVEAAAASVVAASKAAGCSSTTVGSSSKSPSSSHQRPKSALSAALKPSLASPTGAPAAATTEGSSNSRGASQQDAARKDSGEHPALYSPPSRAPHSTTHMTPLSPHAASSSSSRFTPSSAAAAIREAAAAAAASGNQSLRRTASGGVMLSPRSPLTDLDDVLNRSRDQDRPHSVAGAAADASRCHMATSAPSGNAWTPAAAAARAARAAGGSTKPHEGDDEHDEEEGMVSTDAAAGECDASADHAGASDGSQACAAGTSAHKATAAGTACGSWTAAEAAGGAAASAAPAHEGDAWPGSSSSTDMAGAGTCAGCQYVDSFTAAAVAAGILPSPTAAAGNSAVLLMHRTLHAHDSSLDAAAATAYAAAVAALPSDADSEMAIVSAAKPRAMHSPELDPPVALPRLLSRLDAAPGRPSSSTGGGALLRSVSALEPRGVQDLADLVAAAIAQEVAYGKHLAGTAGPAAAAAAAEDAQGPRQSDSGAAGASSSMGWGSTALGSQLTDMPGSQLVQLSLEEVLATALTASQKPAAAAGTADPFSISSADLFADLAAKLKLPARSSPQKAQQQAQTVQQQLDMPISGPLLQANTEQQQSWFGPPASAGAAGSSSGAMQGGPMGAPVLVDPVGLLCEPPCMAMNSSSMAMNSGSMALPVSTGLQGGPPGLQGPPPGLQMPPVSTVSAMSIPQAPAGTALLTAQHLVALQQQQQHAAAQPMQQHQQAMQQQQQMMHQQQQMVTQPMQQKQMAAMQGVQQVQVVPMQQVVGHQQTTVIRLANGQLVQGQVITVPAMQGAGQMGAVSVVAAGHAGAPQGMMMGGVVNGMQQVQHMPPQQQQNRVFYPQTWAPGAAPGAVCTMMPHAGQQQPQHMYAQQGQHMVQVQMQMQGGVLQQQMVPIPAQQPMRTQMQGAQMVFHAAAGNSCMLSSSPAQKVNMPPQMGRPVPAAHSKQQGQRPGSQQGSSVSGSPKVTVLEAPAGPGSAPGASKGVSPAQMQKMLVDPQRHNDTGVYVAWSPSTAGAVSAQSCSSGAAEPGSPAAAPEQHIDLQPTESAQMAADLDELLQQANQELGFSSLPKGTSKATPVGATSSWRI